jgi:hypothetical protein
MSFLTSWFAPDEQERGDALDAQRAKLDQDRYERGLIDAAELQRRQRQDAALAINVESELGTAFDEGWEEGKQNVKGAIASPFKLGWDLIPWQVLALGGVALFVYMGGWIWLKGILPRKAK